VRVTASALALAAALVAGQPPRADDGIPITLGVGETKAIGTAIRHLVCDDSAVVEVVDTPSGPVFRGRSAGNTLCSFLDAASVRRVYRITVVESPEAPKDEPPPPSAK